MHTGTAQLTPSITTTSGGMPAAARLVITEKATIAPIITTSPWAKLISWMMP